MIKIENLSVVFSRGTPDENVALKNINLNIKRGDFITIIGSNGAGKSTLYNAISGTCPLESGSIYQRSEKDASWRDITREPEYRRARYIGRIFQNPLLGTAGNMALEDNMLICRKKGYKGLKISLNHKLREEFKKDLRELDMGLENRMTDNVGLLSGGQRQALTLLMTVMSHPDLLLLDEHTAALDPRNAEMVMKLTLRFAAEYNLTVMMITHNMTHALQFGTRLLMMDGGEIILDLDKEEKEKLTAQDIVKRFHAIKHRDLANDEMLLS
ncbi:MAG: ATP-binding cassette domain-containing protein [Spirochaetaceae bacterium]|jgi:putative ABC transport system ATP-binding protein|nr:ATP-binding cassette domain-containing protein [Spirochaetaceae bacterium]